MRSTFRATGDRIGVAKRLGKVRARSLGLLLPTPERLNQGQVELVDRPIADQHTTRAIAAAVQRKMNRRKRAAMFLAKRDLEAASTGIGQHPTPTTTESQNEYRSTDATN
jgi:hypothetical protein